MRSTLVVIVLASLQLPARAGCPSAYSSASCYASICDFESATGDYLCDMGAVFTGGSGANLYATVKPPLGGGTTVLNVWGERGATQFCCPDISVATNPRFHVKGTSGPDLIDLTGGKLFPATGNLNTLLEGLNGNDTIKGFSQSSGWSDTIKGGVGSDTISGYAGDDYIQGDSQLDVIHGDGGDDTIFADSGTLGTPLTNGELIYGDDGDDTLTGTDGGDKLSGGDGADELYGLGAGDSLCGGTEKDWLYGSTGNDKVVGGDPGTDVVNAGEEVGDSDSCDVSSASNATCENPSGVLTACPF